MGEKLKYSATLAQSVADTLIAYLSPYCMEGICGNEPAKYLAAVGSLRRGREQVGDLELLFVPQIGSVTKPGEMFASEGDLAAMHIEALLGAKLDKRPNINGEFTWGTQNKLAIHKATGLPVDFFATTRENWFMSLVIRTGPAELNEALAVASRNRGLKLHAYGTFTEIATGKTIVPRSEREVFELAGVPWMEPEDR